MKSLNVPIGPVRKCCTFQKEIELPIVGLHRTSSECGMHRRGGSVSNVCRVRTNNKMEENRKKQLNAQNTLVGL